MRASRGSVTAEWALAFPAVILVLAAALTGLGAVNEQARLQALAADAVRLAGLGLSEDAVKTELQARLRGNEQWQFSRSGHHVCVTVSREAQLLGEVADALLVEARLCGLVLTQ